MLVLPLSSQADLRSLSLEELMAINITDVTVPAIHHVHRAGEWMVGTSYKAMSMEGNRDGTDDVSTAEVLSTYPVSPLSMRTEMQMVHLMYAPSDRWTWTVMVPYVRKSMDHRTGMGVEFTTRSEGIGDVRAGGLMTLRRHERTLVYVDVLASLPTGSIDERDATPMGPNQKLPYPMQLGSGTVDLFPALTWIEELDAWSFGVRAGAVLRLGRNDEHYALGNRLDLATWGTLSLTDGLSTSLRLHAQSFGNIDGADPDLDPAIVPTADPNLRGGERIDAFVGLNLFATEGRFAGHRLAVEVGKPLYESLDGPQLSSDWTVLLAWRLTH